MGEAGAVLVLEELEHASGRGAHIYAEVLGYGTSSDARHVTEPDPTGSSPARAMRMAFDDSGIGPDEVDYVNAHGTSTPVGDASETRVLKVAFAVIRPPDSCRPQRNRSPPVLPARSKRSSAHWRSTETRCHRRQLRTPVATATSTTSPTRRARRTCVLPCPTCSASADTTPAPARALRPVVRGRRSARGGALVRRGTHPRAVPQETPSLGRTPHAGADEFVSRSWLDGHLTRQNRRCRQCRVASLWALT
jgi:hypothetical protein